MLNKLKIFTSKELLKGDFGLEREGLRVDKNGELAKTLHPESFGEKMCNPYITMDFSESQVEVITPTFGSNKECYNFINSLYDIVSLEIGEEYLWPQSMPAIIPEDDEIPIAYFCECPEGLYARKYRERLAKKYGGKKQLISGLHYNFSFKEEFIKKLYENNEEEMSYREFKDNIYLKVARNYLKYRWFLVYLMGASPVVEESYDEASKVGLDRIKNRAYSNKGALSYRNSEIGYKNRIDLFPIFKDTKAYIESINRFIKHGVIGSHKELYSHVRLKPKDVENFLESLDNDGIKYLEYRSLDINPFEKGGISLEQLEILQLFNLFLLADEESSYDLWQEEALHNSNIISKYGLNDVELQRDGKAIDKKQWLLEIVSSLKEINKELELDKKDVIEYIESKVNDVKETYAYKIKNLIEKEGFIEAHINLAKKHMKSAYENRYKLYGYEDLELSTQILIKESIKKGIKFDILDRKENFISLKNCKKTEYIKQATKTSKDTYITMLIMENKVVTKKVLEEQNVVVPQGNEFDSLEDAIVGSESFISKPIVVKPKSTNFGLGISIFKDGAKKEDIIKALEIAFKHDETVLIEEFIKGKEYRFLVIGDKVVGILHRVPANVTGDGEKSIEELVEIKNQDPLRGKGYKTPLEKINLDENVDLFLKQSNLDINYIPKKDEVVYLRKNSNISTGGDSIDYTDDIPQRFKDIAVNASKAAGANICGVDMMLEDYSDENSDYGIIELNFNPAIHIHSYPYKGTEREIAKDILKLLELIK